MRRIHPIPQGLKKRECVRKENRYFEERQNLNRFDEFGNMLKLDTAAINTLSLYKLLSKTCKFCNIQVFSIFKCRSIFFPIFYGDVKNFYITFYWTNFHNLNNLIDGG